MRGIDGSLEPVIEGSRIEAQFDEAGAVSGSAGCNSYRGSCRLEDGIVSVGILATTRKFCQRPPGVMEQESRYLELLAAATHYSLDGDTVRFTDEANDALLVMTRAEGAQR